MWCCCWAHQRKLNKFHHSSLSSGPAPLKALGSLCVCECRCLRGFFFSLPRLTGGRAVYKATGGGTGSVAIHRKHPHYEGVCLFPSCRSFPLFSFYVAKRQSKENHTQFHSSNRFSCLPPWSAWSALCLSRRPSSHLWPSFRQKVKAPPSMAPTNSSKKKNNQNRFVPHTFPSSCLILLPHHSSLISRLYKVIHLKFRMPKILTNWVLSIYVETHAIFMIPLSHAC